MGNMILACILLAFVLIFTVVNSVVICNICDEIILLIDENKTEDALYLWNSKKNYIQYFVRDAEIDVISAEVENLGESVALEDGEAEMGKLRLREAVAEIINSESMTFSNVF